MLVSVQVGDLFLDGPEHGRFTVFIRDTQNGTELFIEVSDTDGGQAHILHMELVGVQAFGKTPECIGFPHAGKCGKNPDPPDVFQVVETDIHFHKVFGAEVLPFLGCCLAKGLKTSP